MSLDPIFLGSEFQVNTYTTLDQKQPKIAALADGGFVVTWHSEEQDSDSWGIYGRRYDADGNAIGGDYQVNTHTVSSQRFSDVTGLNSGSYVVVWESYDQDGSASGVYAQMYDDFGPLGGEFLVNSTTGAFQSRPDVASLADGGFVVVWHGAAQDASGYGVFGQRYNAAGVAQGGEFQVNTYEIDNQWNASVTGLEGGRFVVIWESDGQDTDGDGIYGQVYNAAGVQIVTEIHISSETANDQADSSVTALTGGGFVVTWESEGQDADGEGIFAQVFNANGLTVGSEFQVNSLETGSQFDPEVTAMADGGFLIVWQTYGTAEPTDIYAQRYDAAGATIGDEFLVNTTTTNFQQNPTVTTLTNGAFVVSWGDNDADTAGTLDDIFAQQFAAQLFGTSGNETIEDTIGANWLHGQKGDDELLGKGGADSIFGGNGKDILRGGVGADTLKGGGSKDELFGGSGGDILRGGNGNDTLDGGGGKDALTGGSGNDKFVFMLAYGKDKITDFEDDIDTFRLDEDLWGGGLTKQQVINTYASVDGGDIVFDFGSDELRLKGFADLSELKDDMAII